MLKEISFENLHEYISSYRHLNFCSVLNAFIESLKWFITSLERSNDSVQGFNPDLQTEG